VQPDSCPNCGAELRFRSTALPVKVCDFCRSTIVRHGDALELAGTAAVVPDDVSPIQIGTTGRDGTRRFEVIGRVRWRWSDGAWNEWLLLFGDGGHGWLGEASGRFMLLAEQGVIASYSDLPDLIRQDRVIVGYDVTIDDVQYQVNDARHVTCIGSEGELPFAAPAGLEALSVDLLRGDGRCASVQREGDAISVYTGRYVTLAELAPRNLRAIEGWAMPDFAR